MIDADYVESTRVVPEKRVAGKEQQRRPGQLALLASVYREPSLDETAGATSADLDKNETGAVLQYEVDFPVPCPKVPCDRAQPLTAQKAEHLVLGMPA